MQERLPVKVVVIKNDTLGMIKWEQMVFLGNPEYGVDLSPVDFVAFAEACGGRGVRIDEPAQAREQLAGALAMDGPVLIEAVVDPFEPPMPPKVTPEQATNMAVALARGEPNRKRIGLTLFRDAVAEAAFPAADAGIAARVAGAVGDIIGRDDEKGDGHAEPEADPDRRADR